MNPRNRLVPVVLALGLVLVGAGPAPASLCGSEEIAIFASNSLFIQKDSTVTGDVVANSESEETLNGGHDEVALKKNVTITGNVSGHTIDMDKDGTIDGDATYIELRLKQGAVITGTQTIGAPPYTDVPEFQTASPGGGDIFAGAGQTVILGDEGFCSETTTTECTSSADCPGTETCARAPVTAYNNIQLAGGVVIFSGGGSFDASSISGTGSVQFDAATRLRLAGRMNLGAGSSIGATAGGGIDASDIVIYVGGPNGGLGGLLDQPFAVSVGQSSGIEANVYAPNGTIGIDKNTLVAGALLGRDVKLEKSTQVVADSAFASRAPTADPQSIEVSSVVPVTIELTGSDPEGDSLAFSIEISGTGTLGPISEIQDPGQCTETAQACTQDSECPGVETCVLPPVSRATVEYTASTCTPTCPADAFTFGVTDSCGVLATAVVDINAPEDPGNPPNEVAAADIAVEAQTDSTVAITLSAGAPDGVSLTFAVETLPNAPIATEFGSPIETVPFDLPSPIVAYTAPSTPGSDNFSFSARDASTSSPPCTSPSCDTGTVNIGIAELPPLATDLSVETSFNEPLQITLQGNPGGTGTGSGLRAQQSVVGPSYTYFYEAQPISSGGENGLVGERVGSGSGEVAAPQSLGPVGLVFDAGWSATTAVPPAFFWTGGDGAVADSNFTFSGPGCLSVTDDFGPGDRFEISDNLSPIFTTTAVPQGADVEIGPDAAYLDPDYSSGSFEFGAGAHDITITVIASPFGGGRGYIRVDSGGCQPNLTVTSFSAPDSAGLDEPIGSQISATVTNTGTSAIPAGTQASIGYYISADAVITTDDRLLAGGRENLSQQAPNGLAVGESVQINLFSGANISSQFPDGEPLTGDVFIGVLVDEFDLVAETDESDNTASEPIAVGNVPTTALAYTVVSLPPPSTGSLTLFSTGAPITAGQTFTVAPTLLFTPTVGFAGPTQFVYRVDEGPLFDLATVNILVLDDGCIFNGRPVGCAPGGGSGLEFDEIQEALEREVAAGPNRGLTLVVEGVGGSVSSSPVWLSGGRLLMGLVCGRAECTKLMPEGAEVVLGARQDSERFEFLGWGGHCQGSDPIITVVLSEHTRCTAEFDEKAPE